MTLPIKTRAAVAAGAVLATGAFAQTAREDPPLPGPLDRGAVLIPYRTENFRTLPVLGPGALNVSPRAGHLHVTLDDLPWHRGDFSDKNLVVLVGLPPGQHKVPIELANPDHQILTGRTVTFTVPGPAK